MSSGTTTDELTVGKTVSETELIEMLRELYADGTDTGESLILSATDELM